MDILPEIHAGIWNGWIPLVIYLIGLLLSVSLYSKEVRIWLFNNPKTEKLGVFMLVRLVGQLAMVAYMGKVIASIWSAYPDISCSYNPGQLRRGRASS
jgi:hypothetical protein